MNYLKEMHKFGICLPKSVDEAYIIDKENGNDLCTRAISKDITDKMVAFKLLEDGENVPIEYSFVHYI